MVRYLDENGSPPHFGTSVAHLYLLEGITAELVAYNYVVLNTIAEATWEMAF